MKSYIIGRILMVVAFVVCVSLFFLCIDRSEQARMAAQLEQVKDNTLGNTTHCKTLTVEGGWIYFIPGRGYGNLYKVRLDGSERQMLVDKNIGEFVLHGDRIYYPWWDYNEEKNKTAEFGHISSIGTDGSDERQITQLRYYSYFLYLSAVGDRIYYIDWPNRRIHSVALDGSDRRIHNDKVTVWFKVLDDVIYYMGCDMFCSVKTDGSDLTLISSELPIGSLSGNGRENINIFGDTVYFSSNFNAARSLKLDGSSMLRDVKTDGTNIANGRIYYTYYTYRTIDNALGCDEEWVICSAKINAGGEYEDEKILYTETMAMVYTGDHSDYIHIIGDRLYFRSRAPNRSLYSMDLDGGDLWKIE